MLAIPLLVVTALESKPAYIGSYEPERIIVTEFDAKYLPMITRALSHPKMRGRSLGCYNVKVLRFPNEWRVYFAGHRQPRPAETEGFIVVGNMPQNPSCPDIGFMFDAKGKIYRVYGSRD